MAAATAGETIFACAGTYNESVTVNKDITLLGAEFGVPATTPRPGPESIVTGGITYVTGGSAGTVDGFTLDGDGNPNSYGIKGQTAAGAEGYAWEDNIIENNAAAINVVNSSGTAPTLVKGNEIIDNNDTGPGKGSGVFFTGLSNDVTITQNSFAGNTFTDILTNAATRSNGLVVSDNTSSSPGNFIALFNQSDAVIDGNVVSSGQTSAGTSAAFYVDGDNDGVTISGNTIDDAAFGTDSASGVSVKNVRLPNPSTNVTVSDNTVSGRASGILLAGTAPGFVIKGNTVSNSTADGISLSATDTGGAVEENTVSGSAGHDCVDASTGSGTAGTANTWSGNIAATDEPAGICATSTTPGYRLVAANGSVSNFGGALDHGSVTSEKIHLNAPVVGMADTPDDAGYWLAAADGGVFTFGDAGFYGSQGGTHLNAPVVGIAATPDGRGYWLVASDGGVFTFGDAGFFGSMGGTHLNAPVVGVAATPDGRGYWLVASDGGVFTFGDAGFFGSMGGTHLNAPVVGMAATPEGRGTGSPSADGGVFTFGDAGFFGSLPGQHTVPNRPIVGIAASEDGGGYLQVGSDGGVYAFPDALFQGSLGGAQVPSPVKGMAVSVQAG